jgi:hypothetical protein
MKKKKKKRKEKEKRQVSHFDIGVSNIYTVGWKS